MSLSPNENSYSLGIRVLCEKSEATESTITERRTKNEKVYKVDPKKVDPMEISGRKWIPKSGSQEIREFKVDPKKWIPNN